MSLDFTAQNENHSFDIAFYNADGGQADMCQVSYAIGVAKPTSIHVIGIF